MMQFNPYQPSIYPQSIGQKAYTLYIGDLDEQIDENYLYSIFQRFGQITHLKIQKDYETKRSKGFAFVSYLQMNDAENAKNQMNHKIILNKQIRVCNKKSPQELSTEANIVIKNLPLDINIESIDSLFSKFGSIFSSRIIQKNQVAFIQFDNKDSVQKCLEQQSLKPLVLNDQQIQIFQFQKRADVRIQKNNIYLKNFPDINEEEIVQKLQKFCQKFGNTTSILVKTNKDLAKQFAFVCFENTDDAQNAYESFKTEKLFNNECLYVNWAQTRQERNRRLKDTLSSIQNETNMFVKNLKNNVTKQELKEKFSRYGEISSCDVKAPQQQGEQRSIIETKFGFINFVNQNDARKALILAKENEQIQEIFKDEKVYINFHLLKSQSHNYQMLKQNKAMQFVPAINMIQPNYFTGNNQQLQPIIKNQKNNFNQIPLPMSMHMPIQMPINQQQMGFMYQPMHYQQYGQAMNYQQNFNPQQNQFNKNSKFPNQMNFQQQQQAQFKNIQNIPMPIQQNNIPIKPQNSQLIQQNYQENQNIKNQQQLLKKKDNLTRVQLEFKDSNQIKNKLEQFKLLDQDQQRARFGELLYPKIQQAVSQKNKEHCPKITGMLIDFSVFDIEDILELFDNQQTFKERVFEAEELIQNSQN